MKRYHSLYLVIPMSLPQQKPSVYQRSPHIYRVMGPQNLHSEVQLQNYDKIQGPKIHQGDQVQY